MGALTAFLLFRLYFRIFEGEYKGSVEIIKPSRLMYFSLFILAFCIPCFWILAKGRIENFLALQENFRMAELNPFLPLFTVVSSLLGYYIAYKIYFKHDFHSIRIKVVRSLFRRRFGLDYFIKFLLEDFIVFVGSIFAFVEKYVLEFFYKLPKYLLRTVSHLFSDGGQK